MRDSLGVPLQPKEQPHELVAYDWLSRPIFSDDNEEFILIDGEYVLDEPDEIRAYLLQHAVILDTMQIWEDGQRGVL